MAMNKTTLGTAIKDGIDTIVTAPEASGYDQEVWEEVADAIITHIKNNMKIDIPEYNNVGITASGGSGLPAAIATQGTNPTQAVGNGDGNIT